RLVFTDAERAWIRAHPVVRVAVDATNAPYTFIDSAGEFAGVHADLLKMIARRTGLRFEVVPRSTLKGLEDDLRAGRADMVTTLVETPERAGYLAFSNDVVPMVWA